MAEQGLVHRPEPISLERYVEAAGEASKRSRWALIALIVACSFGLIGMWYARSTSWPWARLSLAADAQRCLEKDVSCDDLTARRAAIFLKEWQYVRAYPATRQDALKFAVDQHLLESVRSHVAKMRGLIADRVSSQSAPVVGFFFDINDIGVVASCVYVCLLGFFGLSLRRERQNIEILHRRARSMNRLTEARDLIHMRQVFAIIDTSKTKIEESTSVPVLIGRSAKYVAITFAKYIPQAIAVLPPLILLYIFYSDFETKYIADVLNPDEGALVLWIEALSVALCVGAAVACIREQRELDSEYDFRKWRAPLLTAEEKQLGYTVRQLPNSDEDFEVAPYPADIGKSQRPEICYANDGTGQRWVVRREMTSKRFRQYAKRVASNGSYAIKGVNEILSFVTENKDCKYLRIYHILMWEGGSYNLLEVSSDMRVGPHPQVERT